MHRHNAAGLDDVEHCCVDGNTPVLADEECAAADASDRLEDKILGVHPVDYLFVIISPPAHHIQQLPIGFHEVAQILRERTGQSWALNGWLNL